MKTPSFYVDVQGKAKSTSKPHTGVSDFKNDVQSSFDFLFHCCESNKCPYQLFTIKNNDNIMYQGTIAIPKPGVYNVNFSIYNGSESRLTTTYYNYNLLTR